jgi:hypothetical protein
MAQASPRALKLGIACALAGSVLACGDDHTPGAMRPAPDAGGPSLEIGSGELAFAPLKPDEPRPYVRGSQGGFHVWVSFRERGLDPQRMLIAVTTQVEGHPELMLEKRGRQNFSRANGDAGTADGGFDPHAVYEYAGWPAQIIDAPMHVGERVDIHVSLEDLEARLVHADTTVVIAPAEAVGN